MCRLRRTGFTLVEMLVVITIIGMLMGMLMPAIGAARESARRANCASNQSNIGKAMLQYESAFTKFPGYLNLPTSDQTALAYQHKTLTNVTPNVAQMYGASWAICLFPYLDSQALYDVWTSSATALANNGLDPNVDPFKYVKILVCPSNPPIFGASNDTPLGYVVNCGYLSEQYYAPSSATVPQYPSSYGVCHNLASTNLNNNNNTPNLDPNNSNTYTSSVMGYIRSRTVSLDFVNSHDGAGQTLLLSESTNNITDQRGWQRVDAAGLGFVWYLTNLTTDSLISSTNARNKINASIRSANGTGAYPAYGPSSFHTGGVNVVFCDGHQYFLKDGISPPVYWHLMAPNDKGATVTTLLPNGIPGTIGNGDF
jgi:prepilin-type N-terminal cleavage/methylation domain-containing protein/prepilin-type processing-associated H-X9-DG protein